ncbi:hypothetical protein [Rhodococcus sp. IEGM 1330]|uniref:hypothetical protein n=1 Tax=Rhodococcus sp. IEGM 1330 TaxID=3082225 RepID=UPI002954768F|nr:hypothetical protein [Rhodococcus sp. IEGM 1330]MDV8023085.1 hypothetical protein [Rhodococcus sp. IEGM 1330]
MRRFLAWSAVAAVVIGAAVVVVTGVSDHSRSDATAIPGCDEVVEPDDTHNIDYSFIEDRRYADSDYGWFSDTKAVNMSDALRAALPADTEVLPYSITPPLQFQPFGSETTAQALVALRGEEGDLTVVVQRSDTPAGPCITGYVQERRTLDDGTIIDTSDNENGRRARAYTSDGSLIDVSITGALTVEQLADIAAEPGLRTH